jgi:hypothetical protein
VGIEEGVTVAVALGTNAGELDEVGMGVLADEILY